MSDGNINRNLLPYTQYQSGLRAGQARMRTQLLTLLEAELQSHIGRPITPELIAHLRHQLATQSSGTK